MAWARIRLREYRIAMAQQQQQQQQKAGALPPATLSPAATKWINEEEAEQDQALAVLSQGTQLYLKNVLEKALHCARQRQNLDGIRLWYEQQTTSTAQTKPALSLRLGCDVRRQVAQAAGNAAMTCKRMEEALERQSGVPQQDREFTSATLEQATSMADLSWRPRLSRAAPAAHYDAKRAFEIYGGKAAGEPPLGRVPKKARLEMVDLEMGQHLGSSRAVGRHRAGTLSNSFFY